jgi:hypothetical protein
MATDWYLLEATDYCTYESLFIDRVMYLLSNSTTCLCTLNCAIAQVILHSSVVIVLNGFHKLKLGGFEWNQWWSA